MENKKESKKKKLVKKLTHHYRLLIINEDTYEEKVNFKLNRLNVYLSFLFVSLLLISLTIFLIAFTSLRTYIPGYAIPGTKKKLVQLKMKTDSLEYALKSKDYYINQFRKVLNNDITVEEFEKQYKNRVINPDTLNLSPGKSDSLLRKEVAEKEKFSTTKNLVKNKYNFISPAIGKITKHFNLLKKHFGIDIALAQKTPVKSISGGIILFSDWTKDGGNTIIVKHSGNLISIYKHNKKLLRKTGDEVKQGEVIAFSGNSGELTSGPHLHFELWKNGFPVNPENYLILKR